jgi:hypothetical protein
MYRRSLSLRASTVGPNSASSLLTMTALAGTLVQVCVIANTYIHTYILISIYMVYDISV